MLWKLSTRRYLIKKVKVGPLQPFFLVCFLRGEKVLLQGREGPRSEERKPFFRAEKKETDYHPKHVWEKFHWNWNHWKAILRVKSQDLARGILRIQMTLKFFYYTITILFCAFLFVENLIYCWSDEWMTSGSDFFHFGRNFAFFHKRHCEHLHRRHWVHWQTYQNMQKAPKFNWKGSSFGQVTNDSSLVFKNQIHGNSTHLY